MRTTRLSLFAPLALSVLLLAACSGGAGDGRDIASLGGEATTTTAPGTSGGHGRPVDDAEFEDALLAYTRCMRKAGVEMPEPERTGEPGGDGPGGNTIRLPDRGTKEAEEYEAAEKKCGSLLKDAVGSFELDPEEQERMREQELEYARCMRKRGIDMPDPTFDENGGVSIDGNDGFDPADPEFQEASKACGRPVEIDDVRSEQ